MSEENKRIVLRLIDQAQNHTNYGVIDELIADDFVDYSPLPGVPATREGIHILFRALHAAFPDLRVTVHEQIAEDGKVMTRKTFEGTHGGPFIGIEPTGNRVAFEAIDILTIREGLIREHRVVFDQLTLMQQLGAV